MGALNAKQTRSPLRERPKTLLARTRGADAANLACARDVLADSGTARRAAAGMGTAAKSEAKP
jgi:hypothetical protein